MLNRDFLITFQRYKLNSNRNMFQEKYVYDRFILDK